MGSFILRAVRPSAIQHYVSVNAPGSLKATGRESWRAYLAANSGTGATIRDLEMSFLNALGKTGGTLHDRWGNQLSGGSGKNKERARSTYR